MPSDPIAVEADPTRLAQVIGNLLNNSAKYTPPGGTIMLSVATRWPDVELTVADTGIGIPPDMLDRVFDMFTQVDTSLDRSTAGLGVGLSLAKRLVELHGGTIRAQSEGAGKGSRFTIRLPLLPKAEPATQGPASDNRPTQDISRHRILLADDNVDYASSLAFILRSMGHDVAVTHDGEEALAAARTFRPEVAFLDIGLPKLHGYALARELRHDAGTQAATLVAVTGWGQERDRRDAKAAGFDEHLVKPVSVEQILDVLAKLQP
jgi:CheY-like chemotaxis protein